MVERGNSGLILIHRRYDVMEKARFSIISMTYITQEAFRIKIDGSEPCQALHCSLSSVPN